MDARRRWPAVLAGVTLAAGVAAVPATPAAAAVRYDPATKTGFIGARDVRAAFGWTGATLAARAGDLVFDHDFWADDTYSVGCGRRTFPVVHHRDFGRYEIADAVARPGPPRSRPGYGPSVTGFRLTGPRFGISGTSVAPAIGQPCPEGTGRVDTVRFVATTTGWTLSVHSGDLSRRLATGR